MKLALRFILFASLSLVTISTKGQENSYTVSGRAVDDQSRPVARADVLLYPVYSKSGFDVNLESSVTDSNGAFSAIERSKEGETWYLFVSSNVPGCSNTNAPFSPPFLGLSSRDRRFQGRAIRFGSQKIVDVGVVPVQFWFGDVNLRLLNRGRNLTEAEWLKVWYRIKDSKGNYFASGSVAPVLDDSVDLIESSLKLSLPLGTWSVEILKYDYSTGEISKSLFSQSPRFNISYNDCSATLNLQLQRGFNKSSSR